MAEAELTTAAVGLELHEVLLLLMGTLRPRVQDPGHTGLSRPQFGVLLNLRCRGGLSLGDLAARLGLTPPAMSHLVNGLVERGLVSRERDPVDRRRVVLALTDPGREVLREVRAAGERKLTGMLAGLSAAELRQVHDAARALRRLVDGRAAARDGERRA
jgi:DNA-binding MarR family transcriptional regulator